MTARAAAAEALRLSAAALFAFPLGWMALTALLPESEALADVPRIAPAHWTLDNFRQAFASYPLALWCRNSVIAAALTALATIAMSAPAAFALSRLPFRGRTALLQLLIGAMLVPAEVTLPALFLGLSRAGLSDTFASLAGPVAVNGLGLFLLVQFFRTIPQELLDAAALEGSNAGGQLIRIVLPLSVPALATVALLSFAASWNNFLWPLIVTNSDATRTLPVGLASFLGSVAGSATSMRYGLTMAASCVATLPPLILFLALSSRFERGIALGAGIRR